jgi:hypothetical protein
MWKLILAAWLALNAPMPILLLWRRHRLLRHHPLFNWAIGIRQAERRRRMAHAFVVAYPRHH